MSGFQKLIEESEVPVLVDFWAPWCGPCKSMAPALTEIARAYPDRLKVIKINVDNNPEAAVHYKIQGIPTLILFEKGRIKARESGAMNASQLKGWLQGRI